MQKQIPKVNALKFVLLLGFVSLFADMTYEGSRSIVGPFLAILGASGAVVGMVSGFGECVGYGFRLFFGYLSDKTSKYWLFTFAGYAINLLAVPLLAFADNWQLAASLIIVERFGKAIRSPAKDAMLSYATKEIGRGFGFGLHEAMDQTGAVLGPLMVAAILYYKHSYNLSFALLLIPALLALAILFISWRLFPRPEELEKKESHIEPKAIDRAFWLYLVAASSIAAGFVDFPLISYHFKKINIISDPEIALFFAMAMGAAGIGALLFGKLFDKKGMIAVIGACFITSLYVPFVFADSFYAALFGMLLWGIGLGAIESLLKASIATFVSKEKRATAYGIFNGAFGLFWFLGSTCIGVLYDLSIPLLIIFSITLQLLAAALLFIIHKQKYIR